MNINLDFLQNLLKINTYTLNSAGINEACLLIQQELKDTAFIHNIYPSRDNTFAPLHYYAAAQNDSTKPQILITGHIDTVFSQQINCDFDEKDNKLYGCGSMDMKGGIAVIIAILKKLSATGHLVNVNFMLVTDEEQMNVERYPVMKDICMRNDYALVYEARTTSPDNIVKIVIERKGFLGGKLSVTAAGGHSGVITDKSQRHSAIHELVFQASNILKLADFNKGTTINIGKFNGGTAVNALAQAASIEFDARMKTKAEFNRLKAAFGELTNNRQDTSVDILFELPIYIYPLALNSSTAALYQDAVLVGKELNLVIEQEFRGGGSDANRIRYFNDKIGIIDGLGPTGDGEHTTREYLNLNSLQSSYDFSLALLTRILKF